MYSIKLGLGLPSRRVVRHLVVNITTGRDGFKEMGVTFNEHKYIKYFGFVLFLFADKNPTALLNTQALDVS